MGRLAAPRPSSAVALLVVSAGGLRSLSPDGAVELGPLPPSPDGAAADLMCCAGGPAYGGGPAYWDRRYAADPGPYDWMEDYRDVRHLVQEPRGAAASSFLWSPPRSLLRSLVCSLASRFACSPSFTLLCFLPLPVLSSTTSLLSSSSPPSLASPLACPLARWLAVWLAGWLACLLGCLCGGIPRHARPRAGASGAAAFGRRSRGLDPIDATTAH